MLEKILFSFFVVGAIAFGTAIEYHASKKYNKLYEMYIHDKKINAEVDKTMCLLELKELKEEVGAE